MIARGRFLLSAAIVAVAFVNLWQLTQTLRWVKPREADDVVVLEDRLRFVRDALMKAGYWRGDVGYVPAQLLLGNRQGNRITAVDDQQWALVRYVMIPWNVLQNTLSTPYVLVDGTRTATPIQTPDGFVKVYDSMNGLVLVKKLSSQ